MAEKPGFEPGRPSTDPTPLAGEPLRPLGYFSMSRLAEREGFEPPVPFGITGFQDQRLQPLGHRSRANQPDYITMRDGRRQGLFVAVNKQIRYNIPDRS